MKNFATIENLVKDGMVEEIGAREAGKVVGGGLIIVVCLGNNLTESAKVQMQDFHFVM